MATDFSFDERIIKLYNRQRAHPPDVSQQIGTTIAEQVTTDYPLLEIGVGTGRIAWPAAVAGCDVVGFDLSPHMLGEVYSTQPDAVAGSLSLAQADMQQMPFASGRFSAVLAVHVLHLATDWQQVMREMVRVLRPDGLLIRGDDWVDPQSVVGRLRNGLRMHAARLDPSLMPPSAMAPRKDYLSELGATETTEIVAVEWVTHISAAERLAAIEQRVDNESWILTDTLFERVLDHLKQDAENLWPDLEAQQPVKRRFVLKITRGEWRV